MRIVKKINIFRISLPGPAEKRDVLPASHVAPRPLARVHVCEGRTEARRESPPALAAGPRPSTSTTIFVRGKPQSYNTLRGAVRRGVLCNAGVRRELRVAAEHGTRRANAPARLRGSSTRADGLHEIEVSRHELVEKLV
jgi:hypothetical protein